MHAARGKARRPKTASPAGPGAPSLFVALCADPLDRSAVSFPFVSMDHRFVTLCLCAALLAAFALAPAPEAAAAADTSSSKQRSNLQKEQRTIKGQISTIKKDIEKKQARVESANQELRESEKAISASNRTLKELGEKKGEVENQLADLKREASIVGMHVTEAEDLVAVITQAQFLNTRRHPWQAALTGDNPNDITRMSAILQYMAREQDRTIERLANRRKNIEVVTAKTNATQQELSRIEADEQKNRQNLEKEKSRREIAVNELKRSSTPSASATSSS